MSRKKILMGLLWIAIPILLMGIASKVNAVEVPVEFTYDERYSPEPVTSVAIKGEFTGYQVIPMSDPDGDGIWFIVLFIEERPTKAYFYVYVINGTITQYDPNNPPVGEYPASQILVTNPMSYYLYPVNGGKTGSKTPILTAKFSTDTTTTIDGSTLVITFDGTPVPNSPTYFDSTTNTMAYPVATPLEQLSTHTFTVDIKNSAGVAAPQASATFTVDTTYSPWPVIVPVEFHFYWELGPSDSAVAILGTFNDWANPDVGPNASYDMMSDPDSDNVWTVTLELEAGYYEYKFVVLNSTNPVVSSAYPNVNFWFADPDNPDRVGTYGNSPLYVTSPMVYYLLPLRGSTVAELQPTITAKLFTELGTKIDTSTISIVIDGVDVPNSPSYYDTATQSISYQVEYPLSEGEHRVTVSVTNNRGCTDTDSTYFFVISPEAIRFVNVEFILDTHSPNFSIYEEVTSVSVAGDFNNWSPGMSQLEDEDGDGIWTTTIELEVGKSYEYRFVVNNRYIEDPDNPYRVLNYEGSEYNSVITAMIDPKPRIINLSPENGSIFDTSVSSIEFYALAVRGDSLVDLDEASVVVMLDGEQVSPTTISMDSIIEITYTATDLTEGLHVVTFDVADLVGRQANQASIAFGIYPEGTGFHYVDGFNDDVGDGNYTYPAAAGFDNCCDIRAIHISPTANNDSLHFEIEMQDITKYTKLGLQISNSTWDVMSEVLPQVNLVAPDWDGRGIHLNIISTTSPYYDPTKDNLIYISRDPIMTGDTISVNDDAEAVDKFEFNISLASLESIMGTYSGEWYYSVYAYIMLPIGELEVSTQEGGIDGIEDPDVYDVAFVPNVEIQSRILSNYVATDEVGGPRLAAIGPGDRGMRGILASEIDSDLGKGPTIAIFSEGGRVYRDTLLIGGTISDTTISTATITLNGIDRTIPVTNGLFSEEIVLSEGENELIVSATDSEGYTTQSRKITFTWIVDHSPIPNIVTYVDGDIVTLDASGSTDPDEDELFYSWSVDPDNPELVTLSNPNSAITSFNAPTTAGEYYFDLLVFDVNDSSRARTVINVDSLGAHTVELNDHPQWVDDAIVYEINVRSFSSPYDLDAITARVPELKDLGVTCVWLTPINVGPSAHGYAIADYYDINPDLGTKDDFRELVNTLHENGMYLIMDLVINHTSIEHPFMQDALRYGEYSPYYNFYIWDEAGNYAYYFNWTTLPNLNYDNCEVRDYFIDVSKYWIENFDIDGYRCDVAWGVMERNPEFWHRWRQELKTLKPDILLLAEASSMDLDLFDERFDAAYDWPFRGMLANVIDGAASIDQLNSIIEYYESEEYPPKALNFRFLENHDMERFFNRFGKQKTKMAAACYLTLPGLPLIYAGQEVGELTTRYYIDWSDPEGLRDYYRKLVAIRRTYPALRQGKFDRIPNSTSDNLYSYLRRYAKNNVIVNINFSNQSFTSILEIPIDSLGLESGIQYYLNDVLNDTTYPVQLEDLANYQVSINPYDAQILVLADTALFVGIAKAEDNIPKIYAICQNYPNPFNLTTVIKYQLPTKSELSLKIYNIVGQEVKTLVNEVQNPGTYSVCWDGKNDKGLNVASGIYFYRIAIRSAGKADKFVKSKKMILVR